MSQTQVSDLERGMRLIADSARHNGVVIGVRCALRIMAQHGLRNTPAHHALLDLLFDSTNQERISKLLETETIYDAA